MSDAFHVQFKPHQISALLKPQKFSVKVAGSTPGPPGPQGPPGASTSVFYYKADAQSTGQSDPGSGKLRWNTPGQLDATSLYVDILTSDGFDVTTLFKMMHPPQEFIIQDKDLSQKYQTWRMTASTIVYPDWFEVPVALIESAGPSGGGTFPHNTPLAVLLVTPAAITFRTGHTWGVAGDVSAMTTLPSIFVPLGASQNATLYGVRTKINSGTGVGVQVRRNGGNVGGVVTVTTTPATTTLGSVALADGDELSMVLSAPVGAPSGLSVTLILEQTP